MNDAIANIDADTRGGAEQHRLSSGDRAIRFSTAAVVIGVALVAAFASTSMQELVAAHGEDGGRNYRVSVADLRRALNIDGDDG
jgi:hypothetical protein